MQAHKHTNTSGKLILLLTLFINCTVFSQSHKKDSLLKVLRKTETDTSKVKLLCEVSLAYKGISTDSSVLYAQKALQLTDSLNPDKFHAMALAAIGKAYYYQGRFNESDSYYRKSIGVFKKLKPGAELAYTHINWGNTLAMQGNHSKAIEEGLLGIQYFEKQNQYKPVGDGYNLLGAVFYLKQDFDKAIIYYTKAIDYFKLAHAEELSFNPVNNLGIIYMEKGDYEKARNYYLKGLEISQKAGNSDGVTQACNNLGLFYVKTEDWDQALKYYREEIRLAEKQHEEDNLANAYLNIGEVYRLKKDYDPAIEYALKAQQLANSIGHKQTYLQTFANLAGLYEAKGQIGNAYENLARYVTLKDTILSEENSQQINELQTKYETDKKEKELQLKNVQLHEQDLEADKRSLQRNVLIIVVLLIVAVSVLLLRVYLIKKKDNEIITIQKKDVEDKKHQLEEKQKEIVDSINYALQIQKTLLANHELVNQVIPDSFVFFEPKDIVSGDFYWAAKKDERFYLAVCDSTGHGVPGAFMSLLNINFLNEAINEKNITEPHEIFNHVRSQLIRSISQEGRQDGMDGIIICIEKNTITYASAQNVPVLVSGHTITELDGDKMPVGKGEREESFVKYTLNVKKGDVLYLYTDGYADQFGGPKGKKFKYKPLHNLLLQNADKPVDEQKRILQNNFISWKADLEQVDDVCVIGIRI